MHMHVSSLRPAYLTTEGFSGPVSPHHPLQADLGCIKVAQLSQRRPNRRTAGRGGSRRPGLLLTALSSCHTDASQKHAGLWNQPPNPSLLQGAYITHLVLSSMWPVCGLKTRDGEVSDGFLTGVNPTFPVPLGSPNCRAHGIDRGNQTHHIIQY